MTATYDDPHSKVNARRDELLTLNAEKTRAVTKRIADLKGQVLTVRADADKFARAYHLQKANELRADAMNIDSIICTLTTVELPKLKAEAENIRQFRLTELAAMWTVANQNAQNAKTDKTRAAGDALSDAKSALYGHIASLATAETLIFVRAVVSAETAANVEHSEAGQNLLRLLGQKAAA